LNGSVCIPDQLANFVDECGFVVRANPNKPLGAIQDGVDKKLDGQSTGLAAPFMASHPISDEKQIPQRTAEQSRRFRHIQ
jgi:hypothetical protein